MLMDNWKALIFDIEGTITDIRFVADVLFPYARKRMPAFLQERQHVAEVAHGIAQVRAQMGEQDASLEAVIAQLDEWMAQDKKIGALKYLQGIVWREGFESGAFQGHFYDEVPEALEHFKAKGHQLYIYSSGSIEAQLLLLKYSKFGDLTALFDGHFDTTIGGKLEAESYGKIAEDIATEGAQCLFFSDNVRELEAARNAGFGVIELQREAVQPTPFESEQGWPVWGEIGLILPS